MFEADFSITKPLSVEDALNVNPSSLAMIGDAVQSLYLRTKLCINSQDKTGKIHKTLVGCVNAVKQSQIMSKLINDLNDEEMLLFKKARNLKILTSAKHASIDEYRFATGYEALLGYFYLTNNQQKLIKFISASIEESLWLYMGKILLLKL